ncbi:glycosyl hydrolase family 28-related protein [Methylocella sp.]|uniref:glycosyl hydrolase family 28-related protein n=1 Tax=Methylocella sp. TaxID=1978226 RepID=UPI0037842B84
MFEAKSTRARRSAVPAAAGLLAFSLACPLSPAGPASAKTARADAAGPTIVNRPFTAKPGDVFSLQGSGFGAAPRLFLKGSRQGAAVEIAVKRGDDSTIVAEIPKTAALDVYEVWAQNGTVSSPHVFLNAPEAHHFDMPDIAPGTRFRVFGRNLYLGTLAPTATLTDVATGAALKAPVTLSGSDAYALYATPPAGVVPGHSYTVAVSNGYAAGAQSEATAQGHAAGVDPYASGLPWAYDFIAADGPRYKAGSPTSVEADHHVYNVKTDPALQIKAKGDGKTNDAAAINQASRLAARTGGVVYLPAGVYNAGPNEITLYSSVTLRGAGSGSTKIIYSNGPRGVIIASGASQVAIVDVAFQNLDATSATTNLGTWSQPVSKVLIQRVVWDLGTGGPINLRGDRIAVMNSTFSQKINYFNGDPASRTGGLGPLLLSDITNLVFRNNSVAFATNQNSMNRVENAIIEANRFTRSAADVIVAGPKEAATMTWPFLNRPVRVGETISRVMGRQLTLNFATNVVIQNNTFAVSNGTLLWNNNDGETILNEGGGPNPREYSGVVSSASATTIADAVKCPPDSCPFVVYPRSKVIVFSGAGAGQWRRIAGFDGSTFTVDPPFDVTPAPGDRFAISAPAFENAIIRGNSMSGNPVGIAMYHGAFLNVSTVGNQLVNNGGIYLTPSQAPGVPGRDFFNVSRNIEINRNVLTNASGLFPSYVSICFVMISGNDFAGKSVLGAEARSNKITARKGTFPYVYDEGFNHYTFYQNAGGGSYVDSGSGAMSGVVFQGGSCVNCAVNYRLSTGSINPTIWNAASTNSPGLASTFLSDAPILPAAHGSAGLVNGKD